MIGVFAGGFPGIWSGGVRVVLRGFSAFDLPRVWVVVLWSGDPDEDLRQALRSDGQRPRTSSMRGLQVYLHRLDLMYPADNPGPQESDVTDRWQDPRTGREWLRITIYVEDVAAWHDRFRDAYDLTPLYVHRGERIIDVAEPHSLVLRR